MITALLLTAVSAANAANCVPLFYRSLPRDGQYYYGAGHGETAEAARAEAVNALSSQAVVTEGWEQDDHGVCNGVYYALVRVGKDAAKAATKSKATGSHIESKLDELAGGQRETNERLAELANRQPQVVVVTPATAMAQRVAFVSPFISKKLARVDAGAYTRDDIVMIVASYRTEQDWAGLATFCHKVLDPRFELYGGPEFSRWLASKCVR